MTKTNINEVNPQNIEIFVVIKDGVHRYYLLKVQKRGFDVYCIPPDIGVHHSLHQSGESHFRHEKRAGIPGKDLPLALVMGEAGMPINNGIKSESLHGLGRAAGICTAIYQTDALDNDFQKYNRSPKELFVIDRELFSKDIKGVEVGVWAVPDGDKGSFEFNIPNIPEELLYRVSRCEPQIWIYARPF